MTNRYRPGIRRNTASTPNIYIYCGQSIHDEDALPVICFIPGLGNESPRILIQLFLSGKPVVSHPEELPDISNSEIEDGSDSPIKTVGTICKRIIKTVSYASCER